VLSRKAQSRMYETIMKGKTKQQNAGRKGGAGKKGPKNKNKNSKTDPYKFIEYEREELIQPVWTQTQFEAVGYAINPGNSSMFPWLSKIAGQWEKYKFLKLEVHYRPNITEYSPNAAGLLILQGDYDALDPVPLSSTQMLDSEPKATCMPCKSMVLRLSPREMANSGQMHYVRTGYPPFGSDLKTYDVGQVFFGADGSASAALCGRLYVKYKVRLEVPILDEPNDVTTNKSIVVGYISSPLLGINTEEQTWLPPMTTGTLPATDVFDVTYWGDSRQGPDADGNWRLPIGTYLVEFQANLQMVDTSGSAGGIVNCYPLVLLNSEEAVPNEEFKMASHTYLEDVNPAGPNFFTCLNRPVAQKFLVQVRKPDVIEGAAKLRVGLRYTGQASVDNIKARATIIIQTLA